MAAAEGAPSAASARQTGIVRLVRTLAGRDLAGVLADATALVAEVLAVPATAVFELQSDGQALLLRAGVGWREGLVGEAVEDAPPGSQAAFTLAASGPVLVEDLGAAATFAASPLLLAQGFVSSASIAIPGQDRCFGILGALTRAPRTFTAEDESFLEAAANVIAQAIERTRAEDALRRSQQEFRRLVETISDVISIADATGTIRYVSPSLERVLGYAPQELIGRQTADFVHPEDLAAVVKFFADLSETPGVAPPFECRVRHRDGSWRVTESIGNNLLADPFIAGIVVTARDITERRRAEEHVLREQTARTEVEKVAHMIRHLQSVTDIALAHLSLDDLLRELLGRIREIMAVDTAVILLLDGAEQTLVARAADGLEAAVSRGIGIPVGSGFAGRIAGENRPLILGDATRAAHADPLLAAQHLHAALGVPLLVDGRMIGVMYVGTLAARHFSEDDTRLLQLAASRIGLAIVHARLYEAERTARAEAEAANRTKDEFLATLSHELRTPLTPILTWAQFIRTRKLDVATVRRGLRAIERGTKLQVRLIEDLLDVSRIVSGKLHLEIRPLELLPVIEAALEVVRPAAELKSIQMKSALDPLAGPVAGDPGRLQQVVSNLLSNAVKFTPKHGTVEVRLRRDGDQAEIGVTDTGKGIPADFLPYIFERFRQADSSSTRSHGGLGLGLAIVRHLVDRHGGTVRAESPGEGLGATITVRLPLLTGSAAATAGRAAEQSPGDAPLDGIHVLLVDDDAATLESLGVVLEIAGARVTAASSAAEALTALDAEHPDVLLSDIAMPGEDGYELIRKVRALDDAHGGLIPAAALTAYTRTEDRAQALAAGYQLHVGKPVEPGALLSIVATLAQLRTMRDQRPLPTAP